jgi:hypothetical protein
MIITVIYFFYFLPSQLSATDVLAQYSWVLKAHGNGGIGYLKVRVKIRDVYEMEMVIGKIVLVSSQIG